MLSQFFDILLSTNVSCHHKNFKKFRLEIREKFHFEIREKFHFEIREKFHFEIRANFDH